MTLRKRLGVVAATVIAFGAIFAVPASAHTKLLSSTPARDAKVTSLTEVTLVFSEHVAMAKVQLRDARGGRHEAGASQVKGATVIQRVAPGLAAGAYTIDYRVVSADGHPVEESLPFTITGAAGGATPAANGLDSGVKGPDGSGAAGGGVAAERSAGTGAPGGGQSGGGGESGKQLGASGGGMKWLAVGAGLVGGIGIGVAFVFLRKKKTTAPAGGE